MKKYYNSPEFVDFKAISENILDIVASSQLDNPYNDPYNDNYDQETDYTSGSTSTGGAAIAD